MKTLFVYNDFNFTMFLLYNIHKNIRVMKIRQNYKYIYI